MEKFGEDAIDIEQHITIVPNPRAKRRGSMADYAFPELHSNRKSQVHLPQSFNYFLDSMTSQK